MLIWAVLLTVFGATTAIFGKLGAEAANSDFAPLANFSYLID